MARDEQHREDLLRQATALIERIEIQIAGTADVPAGLTDEPVVAGFRRDGSASIFFGGDPVYQFDSSQRLRRAFKGGLLYRADRGRLVAMQRVRQPDRVDLVSRELSPGEIGDFVGEMQRSLESLTASLSATERFHVIGQVPADADVLGRVRSWLEALPEELEIARSPRAK